MESRPDEIVRELRELAARQRDLANRVERASLSDPSLKACGLRLRDYAESIETLASMCALRKGISLH